MILDRMELLAKALVAKTEYKYESTPSNALRHKHVKLGTYLYTITGVMADIFIKETKLAYWEDDADSRFPSKFILKATEEPWRLDVPPEVLDWYGLTREQSNQLWIMSARGYNFEQIGKAIQKSVDRER